MKRIVTLLAALSVSATLVAQTAGDVNVGTVNVFPYPVAVAVNPKTNQIYVASCIGDVTVIDGSTNSTIAVTDPNAACSHAIAVNPRTNEIYVANWFSNNVTVIDGATNSTITVADPNAISPWAVAVNPVTNQIYVANLGSSNVTVIDGTTNTATTVADPNAISPWAVAVNPETNKVYVANNGSGNVTVIDGGTNTTTTVPAGSVPFAVAINRKTNKIYVVNNLATNGTVTVIDGVSNSTSAVAAGGFPFAAAVNEVTNQIYVANDGTANITVIDGSTNATTTLTDPTASHPRGVAVNAKANKIYVANDGSGTVTVIDGVTNSLTTVADPNAHGALVIPISPVAVNPVTSLIYVTNDGSANVSVIYEGPLRLSPGGLNFGGQVIGSGSAAQVVTLTNKGLLTVTIGSITVTGTNAPDFSQTNTCDTPLAVGASCTISVTFTPAQAGPATASVTITDNALGSPQAVALTGIGLTSGLNATLSATSLTFATQLVGITDPAAQSVTLANYGTEALDITGIVASGDFHQTHTCGTSLAAGASCTISVTFKPTRRGSRTGTMSITDNAPGSPQTVSLKGTGTVVEFNPTNLAFGCFFKSGVGGNCPPPPQTVTLTNTGSTTLSISSIKITGSTTFSQTNTCGSSVAAGGSCTITVRFRPTGIGTYSGAVSVSDNGGGSPQQVPLSGTEI